MDEWPNTRPEIHGLIPCALNVGPEMGRHYGLGSDARICFERSIQSFVSCHR